ncbi:MAG: 4Fe-4S dicluster domain-containing protein [Acidimicrobiales bacterium]
MAAGDTGTVAVGGTVVLDRSGLDALLAELRRRGYRTVGPVARDGAITYAEVGTTADLPEGWHDTQGPGTYRIEHGDDRALFAWAVGPHSPKSHVFPPRSLLWRARPQADDGAGPASGVVIEQEAQDTGPTAMVGVRPCDLAALRVLDRVLQGAPAPDPLFGARRRATFLVAAECGTPSNTCFCTSMGTGPGAGEGFDIALTEIIDGDGQRFVARPGTGAGAEVLSAVPHRDGTVADDAARHAVVAGAVAAISRRLDTTDIAAMLERNLEHPRWDEVADRCLSCGNCTLVCPTCFCSTVQDTSDLSGTVERHKTWASCFDLAHSFVHGGAVRPTTRSRYRQWLTHKLGTWHDQFGMSGCVGCGRCIAWCPVGIDLTEETAAIRATDTSEVAP